MSSAGTDLTNRRTESNLFPIEPPSYFSSTSATSVLSDSIITTAGQTLSDSPPAYDSIPDIQIWTVPQINGPPNVHPWNIPLSTSEQWLNSYEPYRSFSFPPQRLDSTFEVKFKKAKPLTLGILVLLWAFAEAAVGTVLASKEPTTCSESLLYGIPFWTPVCHIATGCMLISAHLITSSCRVKASLVFDIFSIISSCVALTFNTRDIQLCRAGGFSSECCLRSPDILTFYNILLSTNVVILCVCIVIAYICFYVLLCVPREPPRPVAFDNYLTAPPPVYPEGTPPYGPPPAYTPWFKEDDDNEEPAQ